MNRSVVLYFLMFLCAATLAFAADPDFNAEECLEDTECASGDVYTGFYIDDIDTSYIDYYVFEDYKDIPVPYNTVTDWTEQGYSNGNIYLPVFYGKHHLTTSQVKIVGWTLDPEENGCYQGSSCSSNIKTYTNLNKQLIVDAISQDYVKQTGDGRDSITLYPVWETGRNQGVKIYIETSTLAGYDEDGSLIMEHKDYEDAMQITFSQTFTVAGKSYTWYHIPRPNSDAYSENSLALFAYAENVSNKYVTMDVEAKVKGNYIVQSFDFASTVNVMTYDEGSSVFRMPVETGTGYNAWFTTKLLSSKYYVSFDLNTSEESYGNLYFPSEASDKDSLTYSKDGNEFYSLWTPYSSDKCFYGWTPKRDGLEDDIIYDISLEKALDEKLSFQAKSPTTLYAYWGECSAPPESFVTLKGTAEDLTIAVKQKFGGKEYSHLVSGDGIGLGYAAYEFYVDTVNSVVPEGYVFKDVSVSYSYDDEDGNPFGPEPVAVEENGSFVVMPAENQGAMIITTAYVIQATLTEKKEETGKDETDKKDDPVETDTLKQDSVSKDTLKVIPGPVNFAEKKFLQSGNMIQVSFRLEDVKILDEMAARLQVVETAKDTVVIDSLLGSALTRGYSQVVTLRLKNPGKYRMLLTVGKKDSVTTYFEDFSIKAEIAVLAAESWQMISLAAVDTSAIVWDGDPAFYWWDEKGVGSYWQYKPFMAGDSVVATQGLWYSSLAGRPLTLRADVENPEDTVVWSLDSVFSGWNLVANPYGWVVDLLANQPDVDGEDAGNLEVSFWRYNAETADYVETRYAKEYEAVWAKVSKKTDWRLSAEPVFLDSLEEGDTVGVSKKASLAKASAREKWTLQAILSDKNGKRDSWNVFGVGSRAYAAEEPPASVGDHVRFAIVDGRRSLAKSFKEPSEDLEWTVSLSATSDRVGYLTFAGIDGIRAYGYHVYVTVDGNTTEMEEGVPLKVLLKSSETQATVRVAPAAPVVAKSVLKGLRSARLGSRLQVSFDASEGLAGTNALVDLIDVRGHVVSTVSARTVAGKNALVLDAPKAGLYVLRVRAGSQWQIAKVVVK